VNVAGGVHRWIEIAARRARRQGVLPVRDSDAAEHVAGPVRGPRAQRGEQPGRDGGRARRAAASGARGRAVDATVAGMRPARRRDLRQSPSVPRAPGPGQGADQTVGQVPVRRVRRGRLRRRRGLPVVLRVREVAERRERLFRQADRPDQVSALAYTVAVLFVVAVTKSDSPRSVCTELAIPSTRPAWSTRKPRLRSCSPRGRGSRSSATRPATTVTRRPNRTRCARAVASWK